MFPALEEELCLKKFLSAKARLNTVETQSQIALYRKHGCSRVEIHLCPHCECPEHVSRLPSRGGTGGSQPREG